MAVGLAFAYSASGKRFPGSAGLLGFRVFGIAGFWQPGLMDCNFGLSVAHIFTRRHASQVIVMVYPILYTLRA